MDDSEWQNCDKFDGRKSILCWNKLEQLKRFIVMSHMKTILPHVFNVKHLLSMVAGCANIAAAAPDGGKANLDRGAATCATLCNVNRFCKSEHLVQTVHFCSLCNAFTLRLHLLRTFVAICAICNTRSKYYRDHTLVSLNNNVCVAPQNDAQVVVALQI